MLYKELDTMQNSKLYFITGLNGGKYIYKYILADNKKDAIAIFNKNYSDYSIDEIKKITPSNKLIKQYSSILLKLNNIK